MGRIHIRSTVQHVYHSGHCKHWLLSTNVGSITPASCEVLQQRELWIAHMPIRLGPTTDSFTHKSVTHLTLHGLDVSRPPRGASPSSDSAYKYGWEQLGDSDYTGCTVPLPKTDRKKLRLRIQALTDSDMLVRTRRQRFTSARVHVCL